MIAVTVIIPTHDHADTLTRAVASVQAQTLADFELFVVGDGAPARTRELMAEIVRADGRVRWFDCPKGPRHGEIHRHAALQEAQGEIVCYLSDDDLWLARHLQTLREALATADFAHTVHVDVTPDGQIAIYPYDLADPVARRRLLDEPFNFFGLSVAGHTLAAYRRLAHGWRTTPAGLPTDLHMWRQFLAQPWCRARTVWSPSTLQFPSPPRRDWTLQRRLEEIDAWARRRDEAGFDDWLMAETERQRSQAVTARDATIAALQNGLAEQHRGITWLQGEVAERDRGIAQAQGEMNERDRELAALRPALDEARVRLTLADQERARHVEEAAGLRADLLQQRTATAAFASAEAALRGDLARRDAQLDAIHRSRWWRVADHFWRARRGLKRWLGVRPGR
jgi:hypothetical protein